MTRTASKKKLIIIGLTGSIGMGKSTAAQILKKMGFPIYSADQAVHDVLKKGGSAVAPVAKLFPESLKRGGINREILGRAVFTQPEKLKKLEQIIHPRIRKLEREFLAKASKKKTHAAILEIPLLFETGGEERCNVTFCVTAPRKVQETRVLARPNMTPQKLRAILKRQMKDSEKRKLADYVIPTGKSLADTQDHLQKALKALELLH